MSLPTVLTGIAAGVITGAAIGVAATRSSPQTQPPVQQLGNFTFTDETDLANRVMKVMGSGNDNGVVFGPSSTRPTNPVFINSGFESGGTHYLWFWYWPYNNPGEVTVDVGMIADLWQRPPNVWSLELANFDYNPKTVEFNDGTHTAFLSLVTTAFVDLSQA